MATREQTLEVELAIAQALLDLARRRMEKALEALTLSTEPPTHYNVELARQHLMVGLMATENLPTIDPGEHESGEDGELDFPALA